MKYYMGEYWAMMNSGDLEKVEEGKSLCLPNKNKKYRNRHKKVHFDTFSIGTSVHKDKLGKPHRIRKSDIKQTIITFNFVSKRRPSETIGGAFV